MYRVDGSSDLTEQTLDHFEGWRGSRPVRIGNGAADESQVDIYGEAMDAMYLADTQGLQVAHQGWRDIARMIDWVCDNWDQPDEGIWETRGGRKDFTYGRFQIWVALDRATRMAARRGRPETCSGGPPSVTASTTRSLSGAGIPPHARSPSISPPRCSIPRCGPAGHRGYAPRAMARWRPTRDVEWQLKSYCDRRIPGHDPLSASRVAGGRPIGGPAP